MAEEIEKVFEKLREAELKVDEINETAAMIKKSIVEFAAREAERKRQLILEEARAWENRTYAEEVAKAEEQMKKRLAEGVFEVNKVRKRAAEIRVQAEEFVRKALLGLR
ncbi:MAG: hypothetical protein QXF45_05400 [Candidatus Caldarchaeum sp.]